MGLKVFQILSEHRRQGEEDQAFEKRVEGKKAAAKRKATRRCEFYVYSLIFYSHVLQPCARKLLKPSLSQYRTLRPHGMMTICMCKPDLHLGPFGCNYASST